MKKIVLTFGLIAGAILAGMMFITLPMVDRIGFDKMEVIGYTTMVVSFLMVFFGIRSYRDSTGGGTIRFGKAFQVGILITLIGCGCYVIAWEIIYFGIAPEFPDKYVNYVIEKTRAAGATAEALAAKREEMKNFRAMYDNPLINVAITLLEPLVVGLPMTLIASVLLRRNERKSQNTSANSVAANS